MARADTKKGKLLMGKFNPKVDLVFRKLFGSEENKDVLMSLVNSVLQLTSPITEITIKNPYNFASYAKSKESILDIKATDQQGILYDIEIQLKEQSFYGKRALYYLSKLYVDQLEEGQQFYTLNKAVGIHFLDFDYFSDGRHRRRVIFKDADTSEEIEELQNVELYFIELSKYKEGWGQAIGALERWITFLNFAASLKEGEIPENIKKDPTMLKAIRQLETMHFSSEEREIYDAQQKRMRDEQAQLRTAIEKGLAEGMERGIEKGMAEGMEKGMEKGLENGIAKGLQMAIKGLLHILDDQTIASSLGVSAEEVAKIRKEK
ncbi:MAG: Rpn family recombination-promoting nuclease/putative transposase [Oligoflexia bacterium]|nr:Rpn family recombination-promoting nuclease/putative transposase [Oligoflexia bacterium]